jgi:hypothetical protein
MIKKLLIPLTIGLIVSAPFCIPAEAQSYVSIRQVPAVIRVYEPLFAGESYTLHSITVTNQGDGNCDYEVVLTSDEKQDELAVPEEYLYLSPASFSLASQASQEVQLQITIPDNAKPGEYMTYVETQLVPEEGSTPIGAAVATRLYFTIEENTELNFWGRIAGFFSSHAPFSYIVLSLAVSLIAGGVMFALYRRAVTNSKK